MGGIESAAQRPYQLLLMAECATTAAAAAAAATAAAAAPRQEPLHVPARQLTREGRQLNISRAAGVSAQQSELAACGGEAV